MEKLVTTDMIINIMNAVSEEEREQEPERRDTTSGTAENGPDSNPGESLRKPRNRARRRFNRM
jgi:hypothetical protein